MRKDASSTLPVFSTAIVLLMVTSLLVLSHILQPAQAQSNESFRTVQPAEGSLCTGEQAYLTFDAQGTTSSGSSILSLTGGTFQITDSSNSRQILYSGNIQRGEFINHTGQETIGLTYHVNHVPNTPHTCATTTDLLSISSLCSESEFNSITTMSTGIDFGNFNGAVECSKGGGDTASLMIGTTTQDSDGDGIPDSSDRCASNSNQRCYKESK